MKKPMNKGDSKPMKKRILALCMAAGLLLLSGCELVSTNREKDRAQIVAQVGDVQVTKAELYEIAERQLAASGYTIDLWDEELDSELRDELQEYLEQILQAYTEQLVAQAKCDAEFPLTEEEQAELQEQANSYFDFIKMYMGYDAENPDAYQGDIEADLDAQLAEMGTSREQYLIDATLARKYSKARERDTEGVEATEEQIRAKYDEDLAAQKEAAATSTSEYETSITNSSMGDYVLFKAKQYPVVKHILLAYVEGTADRVEELTQTISDLEEEVSTAQSAQSSAQSKAQQAQQLVDEATAALATAQSDNDAEQMSAQQAIIDENQQIVNEQTAEANAQAALAANKQAEVDAANAELTNLQNAALQRLQPTIDTIVSRYNAGESFDTLIEAYNEDPGMDEGSMVYLGYTISPNNTDYYDEFADAAMALTARGQLSDPVLTTAGVHILHMEYTADEEVDIPYETVRELVKSKADAQAQEEHWQNTLAAWSEEMGVKTWPSRLRFVQ